MIAPQPLPAPRFGRPQIRAREAARRRARRVRLQGYAVLLRFATGLTIVVAVLIGYVMLTAKLTSLNYALARENDYKIQLQEETQRLDDQIARLRSRDRLADVAARLHMHDPQTYAIVDLPAPAAPPQPTGIALLGALFRR